MTATGTQARLERIGTDGSYVIVPMDHGITMGPSRAESDRIDDRRRNERRRRRRPHPERIARASTTTKRKGYIVHLNGSTTIGPDENDKRLTGTVEEAIRAGADAVSFHINVGSDHEPDQITQLSEITADADRFGIPVLAMAYARGPGVDPEDPRRSATRSDSPRNSARTSSRPATAATPTASSTSSNLPDSRSSSRAARKVPTETIEMVRGAVDAGGAGISMGRSIFQHENPEAIAAAVSGVVHDDLAAEEALERRDWRSRPDRDW